MLTLSRISRRSYSVELVVERASALRLSAQNGEEEVEGMKDTPPPSARLAGSTCGTRSRGSIAVGPWGAASRLNRKAAQNTPGARSKCTAVFVLQ
eukprot:1148937-Pelagomonas_calceolata.AAC.9